MMVIAIAPALLIKRSPPGTANAPHTLTGDSAGRVDSLAPAPAGPSAAADSVRPAAAATPAGPTASAAAEDTVAVTSPLYTYGVSTLGARLVSAELRRYASMAPGEKGRQAQILPPGGDLLGLTLVAGRDTVSFDRVPFTASATRLAVSGPTPLRLSATRGGGRRGAHLHLLPRRLPRRRDRAAQRRRPQRRPAPGRDSARRWPIPKPTSTRTIGTLPW